MTQWHKPSGIFYRILPQGEEQRVLEGARSPEGRFHHSGQRALYLSPSIEDAAHAVAPYRRSGDPPLVAIPLTVSKAHVVDLRNAVHCERLGIDPRDAAVPWLPQRSDSQPADSWRPADAARSGGTDGMIYTARSDPERWHLVLFRWNDMGSPIVTVSGAPIDQY